MSLAGDAAMEAQPRYHGSLVAFEGPADVVSTQLRLLPTSSQILILPGLESYMAEDRTAAERFSPRAYVKEIHQAASTRHEVALKFLTGSSSDSKRLVFLHGGSASAVSQCISAISEHQTLGDLRKAETMFMDIARGGLSGLDQQESGLDQQESGLDQRGKFLDQETWELLGSERCVEEIPQEDDHEDPITKAMKAADLLYQETESLQAIDCYIRTRPRSLSLPSLATLTDDHGQASPCFVFASPPSELDVNEVREDDQETTASDDQEMDKVRARLRTSKVSTGVPTLKITVPTRPPSSATVFHTACDRFEDHPYGQPSSPVDESVISAPMSPEAVVYGEARVVQMQATKILKSPRRTRSLDEKEMGEALRRRSKTDMPALRRLKSARTPPEPKSRGSPITEDPSSNSQLPHQSSDARFVKVQEMTIRKTPTCVDKTSETREDASVHQDTGASDAEKADEEADAHFQPVLPMHEDLVINFTPETPDFVLDSVIQLFKDRSLPVTRTSSAYSGTAETETCPSTPRTADLFDMEGAENRAPSSVVDMPSSDEASEYDPFAPRGSTVYSIRASFSRPPPSPPPAVVAEQPPTPAYTPQPTSDESDPRFQEFSTLAGSSAVATQNALRLFLEAHFPPGQGGGYHQFSIPSLIGMDRLWKPMFGDSSGDKTADLILAIGAQDGVKKELLSGLMGQIEKLGCKINGLTRSGRLDIRYLIANAMVSGGAQGLVQQVQTSSDSSHLLACLILAQLETYLAINASVRFLLLEYPAEHLSTVLALQRLVGADMVKVAGIMDSVACPLSSPKPQVSLPSSPLLSRGPSSPTTFSTVHEGMPVLTKGLSFQTPDSKSRRSLLSRANYLVPCTATEAEIATFISAIWKSLIEIDSYYMPDPASLAATIRGKTAKAQQHQQHQQHQQQQQLLPSVVSKFSAPASPTSPASPPLTPATRGNNVIHKPSRSSIQSSIIEEDDTDINDNDNYGCGGGAPTPRGGAVPLSPSNNHHHGINSAHQSINSILPMPAPLPRFLRDESPSRASERSGRTLLGAGTSASSSSRPARSIRTVREDGASMYAVSVAGDGEFYDDEERRLMPMYDRRSAQPRKANSRKALKWLGLT